MYDVKGNPIREEKGGVLIDSEGRIIGQKIEIESPGFNTTAFHKEEETRNSRQAIASQVMAGDYAGAINRLLTLIKKQKKEQKK